jgi:hypothetical protein
MLMASLIFPTIGTIGSAKAERHPRRARRVLVVERARPVYPPGAAQPAPLGTFMPTPMVTVGGAYPAAPGYSPLGIYGDQTMALYGPYSPFRTTTAPIMVYARGYDGVVRPAPGVASSYPNLPILSPVTYPTRANDYYAPRVLDDPRATSAVDWIDQN